MKHLIINLILLLGTVTCFAQNYVITGKVIDGSNLKPFEFVDVTIHDASNDKIITGEFTDIDGEFKMMGGSSGVFYGTKVLTDEEKFGDQVIFSFLHADIDGDELPASDDLIY